MQLHTVCVWFHLLKTPSNVKVAPSLFKCSDDKATSGTIILECVLPFMGMMMMQYEQQQKKKKESR